MTERKMDPNLSKFLHTLNEMDFSTLAYRLTEPEDQPAMSSDHAIDAIQKYKGFLFLYRANPGKTLSPSKYVDFVWHTHIMDTELYLAQTAMLFGHELHHFPFFGKRSEADRADLEAAANFAQAQALTWFNWDEDDWCGTGRRPGPKGLRSPWLDVYGNLTGNIKVRPSVTVCMPVDINALEKTISIQRDGLAGICTRLLEERPKATGISSSAVNLTVSA